MKTRDTIANSFKSKLFLVLMIGLSVVCGGYIISALTSLTSDLGFIGVIVNIGFAIAPTVSVVCGWLAFAGKVNEGNIRGIAAYSGFMKVMYIIFAVLVGIVGVVIILLALALVILASEGEEVISAMVEAGDEIGGTAADAIEKLAELMEDGAMILAVLAIVIVAIAMFIIISLASTFGAIKKQFVRLANGYEDDKFNTAKKLPIKRLWIFGVLSAIGALSVIFVNFSSAIPNLGAAAFFIACALWFTETNKAIAAAQVEAPATEEAPVAEAPVAEAPADDTTAE